MSCTNFNLQKADCHALKHIKGNLSSDLNQMLGAFIMYLPDIFNITDTETIFGFIHEHPFATLVTINNGLPNANHIPLLLEKTSDKYKLVGHMAKSNTQWKDFSPDQNVLVIFQGPHAYISPTWYSHPGVPTWNYTAIHIHGEAKLISNEDRLKEILHCLTNKYESDKEAIDTPHYPSHLLDIIVGFEINIEKIQAKYKISQNRPEVDKKSVMQQLFSTDTDNAHGIAKLMQENN
ncbi:MAG: FMN-binding negative transcriptional regulator [Gammaproteobacteria bacterium]|nr:FMN-binding negative transcriptional regulator [Gammaproteobacteria bacterium]